MKVKECTNCGSHEFHQQGNQWICDYCRTAYVIDSINDAPDEIDSKIGLSTRRKFIKITSLIFLLLLIAGGVAIFHKPAQRKKDAQTYQKQTKKQTNASDNISKAVSDWNKTLKQGD